MRSWSDQIYLDNPGVLARTVVVETVGGHAADFGVDLDPQEHLGNGLTAARLFLASQASPTGYHPRQHIGQAEPTHQSVPASHKESK